jgi:amino acid adenylation domain-containing protein
VQDDTRPMDAIAIMGEAERHQVLESWNETGCEYPQGMCVHELFEQQAARTPDAVALVYEGQRLTYAQLNRRANQLAHYLRSLGVEPERIVGLYLERSPEMVVGMLGIFKAGGTYLPLDPQLPRRRLSHMIADANVSVVLTQERFADALAAHPVQAVQLDAHCSRFGALPDSAPPSQVTTGNLAYVIYTSGSTGMPKGVSILHRGLTQLIKGRSGVEFTCNDVVLQLTSHTFDPSVLEIWGALLSGARLALCPYRYVDSASLTRLIEDTGASFVCFSASLLHSLMDEGLAALARVRQVMSGGEVLSTAAVRRFTAQSRMGRLINVYGATEATMYSVCFDTRELQATATSVPVGRPISNTQVYVLDTLLQPVPVGVAGEIYIAGDGLGRGYFNRPGLTADRFIANPFGSEGLRMYRTGDWGRWRAEGQLEFVGRRDHQVKIRGYRIELAEIEAQLCLHERVKEAVVLARDHASGETRLVAYLKHTGAAPDIGTLREYLQSSLPEYMVPGAFVMLDELPLTPNGKLDRNALPAPEPFSLPRRAYEAPRGEVEIVLAQLWSELLGVPRVGREDNFFDLGGHSLLITRLIDAARRRGLLMDLRQVFDARSLAALAAIVRPGQQGVMASSTVVPVRAAGSQRPLFCLHEGFGTVLAYERLVRFIDVDIPVYSLEARALHEDTPIYRPLVDMARDYLKQIAAVQPDGPYRLAGWSGGGLIGYEIAHQLLAKGESVEFLGMIDTYNLTREALEGEIAEAKHYLIRILQYARPDLPAEVLRALLGFDDLEAMVDECHRHGWLKAEVTGREVSRLFQVANDIARACVEYSPPALALEVDLFSALEPPRSDRSNGWARLLGSRLKIIPVEGSHMSMMQDERLIAQIAGPINRALIGSRVAAPSRPQPALHTADTLLS